MLGRSVLFAAVLAAGCLEPTASPTPGADASWVLSGSFTQERTPSDMDAWCAVARAYGNECALMESFPEQYVLRFDSKERCEEARERILAIEHTRPGECHPASVPSTSPETPTSSGPNAEFALDVVRLTWWSGAPDAQRHDMRWEIVRAWSDDGLITINTTTHGIEGGDFRFTLFLRASQPGELRYAPNATDPFTFDLAYTEAVFWAGRPVDTVVSVSNASTVDLRTLDGSTRRLEGTFHLDFLGRCTEAFNCNDRDAVQRTVLDGSFGP